MNKTLLERAKDIAGRPMNRATLSSINDLRNEIITRQRERGGDPIATDARALEMLTEYRKQFPSDFLKPPDYLS